MKPPSWDTEDRSVQGRGLHPDQLQSPIPRAQGGPASRLSQSSLLSEMSGLIKKNGAGPKMTPQPAPRPQGLVKPSAKRQRGVRGHF